MPRFNAPCRDCTRRVLGCQGKCEDYKSFVAEVHAKKEYLKPDQGILYLADKKRRRGR